MILIFTQAKILLAFTPILDYAGRINWRILCTSFFSRLIAFLALFCFPIISAQADPTLAGSLAGDFKVSQNGSATYTIPLSLPPATAKVAPELNLSYDSSAGSGLMGTGWNLAGLSQISRCAATIADDGYIQAVNFSSTDRLCLDGQKLVAVSGTYGTAGAEYRTISESFAKIVSQGTQGTGPRSFIVY